MNKAEAMFRAFFEDDAANTGCASSIAHLQRVDRCRI